MANPSPEARARVKIDAQLADAGWHVCDRNHFTSDYNAVALTEGLLNGNLEADYLLFLDGDIKARSASLSKNVALLEKLLRGIEG